MTQPNAIHIRDANGKVLFNRLLDKGGNVLEFQSGFGHVTRDTVKANGWVIVFGWTASR